MTHGNGGDLLAQILIDNGVDTAFGIVSVHNLPLVEAIAARLRFVPVRHEAAAVNAADGYARARGGLGVAITSTGTGAGNAAGSLVEALTAGSRVLHVTGQIDSPYLGQGRGVIHETRDQLGMLTAVSKHAATISSVAETEDALRRAVREAVSLPCGPSSVEWPIDLQYARHDVVARGPEVPAPVPPPDENALARADQLIASARRPVIWAGGGAVDARDEVRELAERLHAPVFTSNSGRGTLPEDHSLMVGNFATAAEDLLAEADLLISIGTHFRSNETKHYHLALPARHIQIDVDPAALGRVHPATVGIAGEAAAVLRRLRGGSGDRQWRARAVATRSAVRSRLREAIGPYDEICDATRAGLPRESVIARDVTIPSSQWGNRLLDIFDPRTNLFPVGGGIGQGLATGIGAALSGRDAPTLVMAGDGGLAVHLGELGTLAQEKPWLVLVVFNDGGYGVLRNMQDHHGGSRAGVDLYTPDFSRLAQSLDLPYQLVSRPSLFAEALEKAVAQHGPAVIEVDVTALDPAPRPFVPPVPVPRED
ncbi:thiamine pyrophosphate-binding protein [Amycolatopsis thermoflava]|uniref:thiamine pyrophosphate-binding protein n=1 Tax=Amycolatopsis thermoflava TaxID=84480 RepID=UPI0036531474